MGLISSLKSNLQRPRLTTTMRDFLRQKINAIGSLVHVGGVRLTHQGREYIQIWINDDCRDILEIYVWCDMKAFKYFKYASENSERQRGQHSIRGLRVHCTNLVGKRRTRRLLQDHMGQPGFCHPSSLQTLFL